MNIFNFLKEFFRFPGKKDPEVLFADRDGIRCRLGLVTRPIQEAEKNYSKTIILGPGLLFSKNILVLDPEYTDLYKVVYCRYYSGAWAQRMDPPPPKEAVVFHDCVSSGTGSTAWHTFIINAVHPAFISYEGGDRGRLVIPLTDYREYVINIAEPYINRERMLRIWAESISSPVGIARLAPAVVQRVMNFLANQKENS